MSVMDITQKKQVFHTYQVHLENSLKLEFILIAKLFYVLRLCLLYIIIKTKFENYLPLFTENTLSNVMDITLFCHGHYAATIQVSSKLLDI